MSKSLSRYAVISYSEKVILYDYDKRKVLKTYYYVVVDDLAATMRRLNRACQLMNENHEEDLHYLENVNEYLNG